MQAQLTLKSDDGIDNVIARIQSHDEKYITLSIDAQSTLINMSSSSTYLMDRETARKLAEAILMVIEAREYETSPNGT
jgi:hypothetical protein